MKRTYKRFNYFTNLEEIIEATDKGIEAAVIQGSITCPGENYGEEKRHIIRQKYFQRFGFYPRSS